MSDKSGIEEGECDLCLEAFEPSEKGIKCDSDSCESYMHAKCAVKWRKLTLCSECARFGGNKCDDSLYWTVQLETMLGFELSDVINKAMNKYEGRAKDALYYFLHKNASRYAPKTELKKEGDSVKVEESNIPKKKRKIEKETTVLPQ